ncbi:hypothetical protein Murru_0534 [Allomuricauda ruestringensis DSM 13258]|uniref:SbsA Ig-like domain-containing protein n=1 Tax=Allomuricauda ruestringensis (strain DSM 13258 / CIP 107369 / LMG 19739 / B1) TaxID=886377 RepID=G2PSV8_ALLRU|nr:Ig-like domain-containing protein [Allomuricauda ruestringensis]AEM69585.1 hypothetical protein Murru_0534 [Allomuricauda ruestringensis DSM 13258]
MNKKNRIGNVQLLFLGLVVLWFTSCSEDEDVSVGTLSVISVKLNDNPFVDDMQNVPVSSTIELVFSAIVVPEALEKALYVSTGSENVPYMVQYLNQSTKVLVNIQDMSPNTVHTLGLNSGQIGAEGKILRDGVAYSFTTEGANANAKTPCLSASEDCMQQLSFLDDSEQPLTFNVYANYDFIDDAEFVWDFIDKVVVVVHGANRDADDYYGYMINSLRSMELEEATLVIAPHFQDNGTAPSNGLVWNDSRWREGANAGNNNVAISSFTVMDSLVNRFSDPEKFPNLETVFLAGHSSGAAFTQHYALANKVQDSHEGIDFQHIVANNQYFYYPDGQRYDEEAGTFYEPMDCTGYDYWPYGYEFAVPYLDGVDAGTLTEQQVSRSTIYFLGSDDTSTTGTLNTTDCQATLLGSNRFNRGSNMYEYMETFYPSTHNHREVIVPNVGHDANGIFNSSEFKQYVMEFE